MGVLLPWFVAAGLQTVRDVRVYHRPPLPSEFVSSGIVFGGLTILGQANEKLATYLAWGVLIALVLKAGGPSALATRSVAAQGGGLTRADRKQLAKDPSPGGPGR